MTQRGSAQPTQTWQSYIEGRINKRERSVLKAVGTLAAEGE